MSTTSRLPAGVGALARAVLDGRAHTPARERRAIAERSAALLDARESDCRVPELVLRYTDKVSEEAYKVTDEDIAALKSAGYTEDQIFEFTLSAALGAALARFQHGLDQLNKP